MYMISKIVKKCVSEDFISTSFGTPEVDLLTLNISFLPADCINQYLQRSASPGYIFAIFVTV